VGPDKRAAIKSRTAIMKKILVLNGPNLDRLGIREPEHYGNITLKEINALLTKYALEKNIGLDIKQSNSEAELIELVYKSYDEHFDGIVLNAGAYTHTSIALRDALLAVKLPFIEVHISNIYKRESFRQHSYLSDLALGLVIGLGGISYKLALEAIVDYLK
jgi:3-dehydroquinate dehydratase-2